MSIFFVDNYIYIYLFTVYVLYYVQCTKICWFDFRIKQTAGQAFPRRWLAEAHFSPRKMRWLHIRSWNYMKLHSCLVPKHMTDIWNSRMCWSTSWFICIFKIMRIYENMYVYIYIYIIMCIYVYMYIVVINYVYHICM